VLNAELNGAYSFADQPNAAKSPKTIFLRNQLMKFVGSKSSVLFVTK
jgi:hypothetical protein